MKSRKGFSSLSVQLTATVSVALVLLLLGIVASLGMAGHKITDNIKEQMGFDVTLDESATLDDVNYYKQLFGSAPYVSSFSYRSPDEILGDWREDMGENLSDVLDMNPFLPEFEVNVKAAYAAPDSLDAIMIPLASMPHVEGVNGFPELAGNVNRNLNTLMTILILITLALLPISIILIINTIRLDIYARRFTIHTMKLVGASRAFIRRPFMLSNALQGLIAAILAGALLYGLYAYVWSIDPSLNSLLSIPTLAIVCAAMLCIGPMLCLTCAAWSTQRYLSGSYDDLF